MLYHETYKLKKRKIGTNWNCLSQGCMHFYSPLLPRARGVMVWGKMSVVCSLLLSSSVPTPGALTCWARRFIFSQNVPYNNSRRSFFQIFDKIFFEIIRIFFVFISCGSIQCLAFFSGEIPDPQWAPYVHCWSISSITPGSVHLLTSGTFNESI